MSQSIVILGRQPKLGLAELESLLGAAAIEPLGKEAAVVDQAPEDIPLHRLGGTIKVAKLLTFLPYTDWPSVSDYLRSAITEHLQYVPEGKIRLGLSIYGLKTNIKAINATGLSLKKVIREHGRSIRVVPNKAMELNTAQVLHNQLTGPTGMELLIIQDGNRTALAQTVNVQDIDAYAARDQKRPKRDARVGMLPPKLAQIIINLGTGKQEQPNSTQLLTVLDPFCGTGVLLQEALLMGYGAYGTDIEPRMVEYSRVNLEWLRQQFALEADSDISLGDATNHQWQQKFDVVACESYLGQPLTALPKQPDTLQTIINECDAVFAGFLKNLAEQVSSGFRLCIAVPAWKQKSGFKHLPSLDHLEELGYTRMSFVHSDMGELVYHRPDQIVARELVVLNRF